jgi:hypothetical protein
MTTSGGSGSGPQFGQQPVTFGGIRAGGMPTSFDKVYVYEFDAMWFTSVLINSGYRLYKLTRVDNGGEQKVWSISPDLSRYAEGFVEVFPRPWPPVSKTVVVLIHDDDGGYKNQHGRQLPTF